MSQVQIKHDLKRKSDEHDKLNRSFEEKSAKLGDLDTSIVAPLGRLVVIG